MHLDEIVLPETKPETEWVRGRALQKVSPRRDHARLQLVLGTALNDWARGRGEVGTEWRFRVPVPGEAVRPLVPDISYVENAHLENLSTAEIQAPLMAPDVAVEILSPDDAPDDVDDKIDSLILAGTQLVIVVDGDERTIVLHDPNRAKVLVEGERLEHEALPGFGLDLRAYFAEALDRG
jgi:Uma2 family endonuclease